MIQQNEINFSTAMMCRLLSVSRSHYYACKHRKPSAREQANTALADKVIGLFESEKKRAGSPRITRALHDEGLSVGRHRVAKIMRKNGLRAKAAKKYKATTNSDHKLPVAPNLLNQNFEAKKPDKKYVSDITYIGLMKVGYIWLS